MVAPLVSVLLPIYNAGPYLAASLSSILRQDYDRLEIIAIDDGSTDNSLQILQNYRKSDNRISIISRENRGLIATLNEGLAVARGELVARMDADDVAYPWRLLRQVDVFMQQRDLALCGAGVDFLLGSRIIRGLPDPVFKDNLLRILSMFFTIFMHPTVVYNRNIIDESILYYDENYRHAEDFDLFRRLADQYPAAMIPENLIAYRIHRDSVTNRHKQEMRRTHLKIVAENLEREGLAQSTQALRDIGQAVTMDTVRRAAEWLLALEERISRLPAQTRPSFEAGTLNLFYFLYQLIGDEMQPLLTHEFLTRTAKWDLIRRRERYGLRAGAYAPWFSLVSMSATRQVDALSRYLQSVPAAAVLPSLGLT
ncbi:glycosyltransferase [Mesorhizobium sp. YC-39]|uniref:glycosyltransferase family 2 protein n=1 Tax=unclassified Mesorhizobium TaxID=325217 RepID=UPI0021E6E68E|nr:MULTISPECIES: glycosyltransferase [unclassified Mesorhizobium]MCV3210952.1 glycosyltransferase [Mesorhizobium sp. YC-2]MCV3231186.1 glycosyltransferase [Mesorhizobium sp. YC-39]